MTTATIDRPQACAAPKTGLTGYKQHRCRCAGCLAANRAYNNRRDRLIAYGRWDPLVDAEPVRQHILALGEAGIGWVRAAQIAGVSQGTVSHILYSKAGRPRVNKVKRATADALLAIQPSLDLMARGACIDATGTRRRTQALAAIGWSISEQARRIGRSVNNHKLVLTSPTVQIRTAELVTALYDELCATPAPAGYSATRTRRWAKRNGFAPPLAWDDIDDPNEEPKLDAEPAASDAYDPITVGLAVDGRLTYEQLAAHQPDLIEAVRRLATRMQDKEIADHLQWPGRNDKRGHSSSRAVNAVMKLRQRHDIPPCPQVGCPIPHRRKRRPKAA